MSEYGESMLPMGGGYSLIGGALMIPEAAKDFYDGMKALTNKDYESALKFGGLVWLSGVESYVGRQQIKSQVPDYTEAEIDGKTVKLDNKHTIYPYEGVKNASEYLQEQGVPRAYRKQILESFDIDSINIMKASDNTYGLRFYDNVNAYEKGRYLFPSFGNSINRNGLALPYEWNNMTNVKQWKIEVDTIIIKGKVAPQLEFGSQYKGGAEQWDINDLNNLK
jgi:hypothetical protein